jgi:hypothetical protein
VEQSGPLFSDTFCCRTNIISCRMDITSDIISNSAEREVKRERDGERERREGERGGGGEREGE